MTVKISQTADVQKFFEEAAGYGTDQGAVGGWLKPIKLILRMPAATLVA